MKGHTMKKASYKIRFNPKTTVKTINATLDAIDNAGGYCPCQVPSADSKCHCKDLLKNKALGEPCICGIYVKMAKDAKKKGAK